MRAMLARKGGDRAPVVIRRVFRRFRTRGLT